MGTNSEGSIIVKWINDVIKTVQAILFVVGALMVIFSGPILIWRLIRYRSFKQRTDDPEIVEFIKLKCWAFACGIYAYMLLACDMFSGWFGFDAFSKWFVTYWPTFSMLLYGSYGTPGNELSIIFGDMLWFTILGFIINAVANSRGRIIIRDDGSMMLEKPSK
jgi:hypothetical protein